MAKSIGQIWLAAIFFAFTANLASALPARSQRVSLIRLLAEPDSYDGHAIEVAGYFVFEEENHSLFLSPDDAKYGITNGGIELNFYHSPFSATAPSRFNRRYVSVVGVFHAHGTSQWPANMMEGIKLRTLTNILRLKTPPYAYGPPEQVGKIDHLP